MVEIPEAREATQWMAAWFLHKLGLALPAALPPWT
jgi:hypothetical protein